MAKMYKKMEVLIHIFLALEVSAAKWSQ